MITKISSSNHTATTPRGSRQVHTLHLPFLPSTLSVLYSYHCMPASTTSTNASPRAPISPFSFTSAASDSHYTSDDLPDLGAFNTVLREWIYLQPPPRIVPPYHDSGTTASGSSLGQDTGTGTDGSGRRSTVWNHVQEYLASESNDHDNDNDTETEGARSVTIETVLDDSASSLSLPPDSYLSLSPLQTQPSLFDSPARELELEMELEFQPSLGYLDEALSFLAAERARLDAKTASSPDAWKHVIEPRRKRRRRRPPKARLFNTSDNEAHVLYHPVEEEEEDEGDDEHEYQPRLVPISKSTPLSPSAAMSSDFTTPKSPRRRSRSRSKHKPILSHSRSTPSLRSLLAPPTATHRLVTLARYLAQVCPTERTRLAGVEKKLLAASGDGAQDLDPEMEMELDPRGRAPGPGDPPIHVFIDHSNILFGLLTYLKRHPPPRPNLRPIKVLTHHATTMTQTTPIPLPSFATAARSLSVGTDAPVSPTSPARSKGKAWHGSVSAAVSASNVSDPVSIPTPISVSTSSDDILLIGGARGGEGRGGTRGGAGGGETQTQEEDLDLFPDAADEEGDAEEGEEVVEQPKHQTKRPARHLSHTALSLILERGRPITRRVVVTSSPLYQPMEGMERLGYEVRVYLRVPDLGDGMDRREKNHGRTHSGGRNPSWSPKKGKSHARGVSGSTSADSAGSPGINIGGEGGKGVGRSGGGGGPASSFAPPQLGVGTQTPDGVTSSFAPGSSVLGQHFTPSPPQPQSQPPPQPQPPQLQPPHQPQPREQGKTPRIRYREQGVDELLQLKLHQALAATDEVPEGATIVLATGDGNVGQFSEDGFLGPVRTALKRGWRVELYAWEDGLSRAWRREFGIGSEWARNGMFQIIGMEQFAASLVKGGT
ncbi:hypothetical protein FPV67DRAFT_1221325 [Lyophyllum atratum]|nr:hypothetical protein FPV67DRAFT_1221325 [Lyophyllum atratum]